MISFTDASRLESVVLNNTDISDQIQTFGLDTGASLIDQPIDSLADHLLTKNNIYKVNVDLDFPKKISIKTNTFRPLCYLLDRYAGTLVGVNHDGRMVPLDNSEIDWENPVLTTVDAGKMYGYSTEVRVKIVTEHLTRLKNEHRDLYRLLDEIDFGNSGFLKVSLAGLDYRLKIRADHLFEDMVRYLDFISRFNPDIEDVKILDLCYNDMIICQRGKK